MSKTIIIAAGGTGGHLYPAMAVAEEIRKENPDVKIIFIGTRDRIESKEVPRAEFLFMPIDIHAPRKSFLSLLTFPVTFAKAFFDCLRLMAKERPLAMLGAGAYLSLPVGLAAWSFHVPIALLEINSIPGSANTWLARLADRLFLAYPEALKKFPKRILNSATVCGTPVRGELGAIELSPADARQSFELSPTNKTILVFGGSLGARPINEAMQIAVREFASHGYNVLWQTGKSANVSEVEKEFSDLKTVRIREYIYEMEKAYRAADLVICRAGASSLAELARLGKPAVLVPWSGAMANHQEMNARAFEQAGAAMVLRDDEVRSKLAGTVLGAMSKEEELKRMSEAMHRRDHPDAATIIAEWLLHPVC
ncbi:MAG TPA: undecaprenyldiphospho-muramoylpentapeptide beta-N-acetylglucosaminyltransferase [Candidatus Kapabacteria bacterium]